jgi:hypothetical protein
MAKSAPRSSASCSFSSLISMAATVPPKIFAYWTEAANAGDRDQAGVADVADLDGLMLPGLSTSPPSPSSGGRSVTRIHVLPANGMARPQRLASILAGNL